MPSPVPVFPPGPRTAIRAALLSLVQGMTFTTPINGASTWRTTGPRLRLWGDVPSSEQPACFITKHRERVQYSGVPSPIGLERRILRLSIYCYSRTDDPSTVGSDDLDIMLEAFDLAFTPDRVGTMLLTLGNGLSYNSRIDGEIFCDPGDIDNQAMLILPFLVEMP